MHVNLVAGAAHNVEGAVGVPGGTQFTCFTSSEVQILTQKALLGVAMLPIHVHPKFTTCFTSTKVQKLWLPRTVAREREREGTLKLTDYQY